MVKFEIVGTLDFSPNTGDISMESEVGVAPIYMWWHTYLVSSSMNGIREIRNECEFCVVDNLDEEGKWFIVKDLEPLCLQGKDDGMFTIINKRCDSCVNCTDCMIDETEDDPIKAKKYMHIGLAPKRTDCMMKIQKLLETCTKVYPVMSLYPSLHVCDYVFTS